MQIDANAIIESEIERVERSIESIQRDINERTQRLASEELLIVFCGMFSQKVQGPDHMREDRAQIPMLVRVKREQEARLKMLFDFQKQLTGTDMAQHLTRIESEIDQLRR